MFDNRQTAYYLRMDKKQFLLLMNLYLEQMLEGGAPFWSFFGSFMPLLMCFLCLWVKLFESSALMHISAVKSLLTALRQLSHQSITGMSSVFGAASSQKFGTVSFSVERMMSILVNNLHSTCCAFFLFVCVCYFGMIFCFYISLGSNIMPAGDLLFSTCVHNGFSRRIAFPVCMMNFQCSAFLTNQ